MSAAQLRCTNVVIHQGILHSQLSEDLPGEHPGAEVDGAAVEVAVLGVQHQVLRGRYWYKVPQQTASQTNNTHLARLQLHGALDRLDAPGDGPQLVLLVKES